MITDWQQL